MVSRIKTWLKWVIFKVEGGFQHWIKYQHQVGPGTLEKRVKKYRFWLIWRISRGGSAYVCMCQESVRKFVWNEVTGARGCNIIRWHFTRVAPRGKSLSCQLEANIYFILSFGKLPSAYLVSKARSRILSGAYIYMKKYICVCVWVCMFRCLSL